MSSPVPDPRPLPVPRARASPKAKPGPSALPSYASFSFHRPYLSGYAAYINHPFGGYAGSNYNPYIHGLGYYGSGGGYLGNGYGYGGPWW